MPNITFFIDWKNIGLDGKCPVKVNVSINSKNVNKTVTRIKPAYWYLKDPQKRKRDPENGATNEKEKEPEHRKKPTKKSEIEQYCIAGGYSDPDYDQVKTNQLLNNYKTNLSAYFQQCAKENVTISSEVVKGYFKGEKVATSEPKNDFFQAWDEYLIWGKEQKKKKPNSTRGIKTTGEVLKQFRDNTGFDLSFDNITPELFGKLKSWMLYEKDYAENYFSSTIRRLKAFLNSDYTAKYY